MAPYDYEVDLTDLDPGEYGSLAPGALASSNMASQGKIYTFRLGE